MARFGSTANETPEKAESQKSGLTRRARKPTVAPSKGQPTLLLLILLEKGRIRWLRGTRRMNMPNRETIPLEGLWR